MRDAFPLVVKASKRWQMPALKEVWAARELLWILTLRDIKVRYKQSLIGIFWALLQPLLTMIIFSLVLGRIVKVPTGDVPYSVFCLAAIVPWLFFQQAFTQGTASLTMLKEMIGKIYFPRLIVPLANVLTALIDFAVGLCLLMGYMIWQGGMPGLSLLALPFFIVLNIAAAFAVALWLSILFALYRDVQYALPFLVQIGLYASPILYPISMVPPTWQGVYICNPIVGIIEGTRWSVLGDAVGCHWGSVLISCGIVGLLFVGGLFFFNTQMRTFVDRL